jgi:hypothetical protein
VSNRRNRSRRVLGLESLEIRNAPSHMSALAVAFTHVQHHQPNAYVEKNRDSHAKEYNQSAETRTALELGADSGSPTASTDASPNDSNYKDPKGQP